MKITLTNPTHNELSAVVAEHVAKLSVRDDARISAPNGAKVICHNEEYGVCSEMIPYATSADAVLPLLEKHGSWEMDYTPADLCRKGQCYRVRLGNAPGGKFVDGEAPTFPLAAGIALLRANGVEVVFTGKVEA